MPDSAQARPRTTRARGARRSRRRAVAALALCVALSTTVAAWAYLSASATPGSQGAAVAATVNQGATPTATATAGRKVTVSWGASTLSNGHAVDGYLVKRYDAGTGALQTTLAGCAGTISATTCIEAGVPAGQWKYSVTPLFAADWRGAEGLRSGIATVGAATMSLAKTLFGAPLPQDTTGSLAGFAASEGVGYRLDASTALTGSPSSVGSAGTATISSLTIPATSDGAHTVYALGDASPFASQASTAIVTDRTAPTVDAQLTPAPNAAGWNVGAPVQVALSADDGTGSGIDHIRYTTDGSDPLSSGSALNYSSALSISSDATVRYAATDLAGNSSATHAQVVRFDAIAPVNVLTLSSVSGSAYMAGTTVYYLGTGAGSFTLTNAATDAGGSGPVSSATAALSGTSSGWSHSVSAVTTPAGGPYVSSAFSWAAGAVSSPGESVTATDAAGNTTTTALTFTPDATAPSAGALTVNGVAGSGAGTTSPSTTGSFSIVRSDFTDDGSGLLSSVLTRETATLSSAGGIAAGTCGTYGSASVLTGSPAQTVTGPNCYRYTLTGTDRLGNVATISTVARVDSTAPSTPTLALSAASGNTYISGSTVFINPQGANSGAFQVAATTTDADSGIEKVNFPALTGFSSGGGDDTSSPFATSYAWSGAVGASGTKTVTSTNTAANTATSTFTVTPDTTAPATGALTANGSASASTSATGSFAIVRTDYTDGGSGLLSSVLTRETATLSSADGVAAGTCGSYGTATVLVGNPAQSVTGPSCYRYTLTGTDQVGNVAATSTIVKVDTTAPSPPVLTLSGATGNTDIQGATVFINAQAARSGGFTVTAATTDSDSGIQQVSFPVLTGFGSGDGDDVSSPFATTYAWSGAVGASGAKTVTSTNTVAGTSTNSFTVTPDTTAPVSGALTVNGVAGTGPGSTSTSATGSFAISVRTDYTDAGSGLLTSVLTRETATLSSTDAIASGSCGTYGSAGVVVGNAAQTVTGPSCYRYTLTGTDRVGNAAAISTVVKVDTTAPSAPALTLSAATGNTYVTASTVLINPQAGKSGSFQVAATTSDADSGILGVNFPTLTGFSSGGGDDASSPYSTTYNWSGAVGASGSQTVTATNNVTATGTSAFTVTPDTAGPTVTAIASHQSGGAAGNGKLETGDQLVLTFSEELLPGSVPSTFSGTENRAGSALGAQPHVFLSIPNLTNGSLDTGDNSYLANGLLCVLVCASGSATFSGNATLAESGSATTVTLTVTTVGGDATAAGSGALAFKPAPALQDRVGNGATGTFTTAGTFKLF